MSLDDIHPYVWWVKIRDAPGAPDSYTVTSKGTVLGRWIDPNGVTCTVIDPRKYGFEKCFCDPTEEGKPADGCPAHGSVCI